MHLTHDSCIELDFLNYTPNENTREFFVKFFATIGTQNFISFRLHKILVKN